MKTYSITTASLEKTFLNIKTPVLAIVVPCYNEELTIRETRKQLGIVIDDLKKNLKIHQDSFIYFVDDGSNDETWNIIVKLHEEDDVIKGLKLSRNVGHQNALVAGLSSLKERADVMVTIDADLQDDASVIGRMLDLFLEGYEIVYGVRKEREQDSILKKYTALFFYKFIKFMGVDVVYNHADYRLTSRRIIECLADYKEVNLFLRGIFPLIGFRATTVYYNRTKRFAGNSKYPLKKMISFALDGITSFSVIPLRVISISGLVISTLTIIMAIWVFIGFFRGKTVPGWASIVLPINIIGGFQLLAIGLIGEYIGKIYSEVKSRPRFIKDVEIL